MLLAAQADGVDDALGLLARFGAGGAFAVRLGARVVRLAEIELREQVLLFLLLSRLGGGRRRDLPVSASGSRESATKSLLWYAKQLVKRIM